MVKTTLRGMRGRRLGVRFWLVGILFACLSFGAVRLSGVPSGAPKRGEADVRRMSELPSGARRKARTLAGNVVSPSLEMKENVDFLLTPAILVQEAMSSGVMPTYPAE